MIDLLFAADEAATPTSIGAAVAALGNLSGLIVAGYYFLKHIEKKDQQINILVADWQKGEQDRIDQIEKMGDKFDVTVRQFNADQRTIIDQTMQLHKSTIQTVTENTHAISALTSRIDGFEKRLGPTK